MRQRRDPAQAAATRGVLRVVEEESARAARESERFIAVVSHELRQPLSAAVGAMSLLDANPSAAATERARLVLRRQLLHLSTLLDDLRDMSRVTLKTLRVERSPLDIRTAIEDAIETVESSAERAGITIESTVPGAPVTVLGDASRLHQALSNLLVNAVRYTPRDGRVRVSLTVQPPFAAIAIEDTGQGIAPEDLDSIFEPFWRGGDGGPDGFGIGLALVRGIVELHGGTIGAFSAGKGLGSSFRLTVPMSETD